MSRSTLPNRRESENFTMEFQCERYSITCGHYPDGRIGEIFINRIRSKTAARLSETLDAACRDAAIMMSMAIQHGANLLDLEHSVTRDEELTPMSIIGAIIDSLVRTSRARALGLNMESKRGQESQEAQEGGEEARRKEEGQVADA